MDDSSVKSRGNRIYQVIITLILIIFALCAILLFIMLLSSSLTDEATLLKEGYAFIPKKFSAYAYEYLFSSNGTKIFKSYGITLVVTAIGTTLSLLIGPILATIGLMVGLGYWNDWTNGLYYISDTGMYSLQQFLKSIIDNISALSSMSNTADAAATVAEMPSSSIRMAMAVIGVIPIMILYPFFQKAFVAGIAFGGVKE